MHMFWHAPRLTQPSHRSPTSAMSAESSVENVTNRAAKERVCEGNYRYFKVDVETKERPRKNPFFLKCDSGGHHSTRGE